MGKFCCYSLIPPKQHQDLVITSITYAVAYYASNAVNGKVIKIFCTPILIKRDQKLDLESSIKEYYAAENLFLYMASEDYIQITSLAKMSIDTFNNEIIIPFKDGVNYRIHNCVSLIH